MRRSAFTFIEIIFTILILGFIATGLPMILATDLETREESLVQEAIYASVAKMSQILSYKWDDASNEDNNTISGAKVLDINASIDTDIALDRNSSKFRVGHFQETGRRSLYSAVTSSSILGNDANDAGLNDDIDDGIAANFISGTTAAGGYKENYTINVVPSYIIDLSTNGYVNAVQNGFEFERPTNNPTNIKRIEVQVLDNNGDRLFTLKTYSSNIGETSVASRIFN